MPPTQAHTLVLTRADVVALLDLDACIDAVEDAFRAHAAGYVLPAGVLGTRAAEGGFHVKVAGLRRGRPYYAAKVNANFPGNAGRGLPTIQGVVALHDAADGSLLALLDSGALTALRTAAATAVAARHLARVDARTVTVVGCGVQGRAQLRALARVRPLARAYACDHDAAAARAFADELSRALAIPVEVAADHRAAASASDVVVTCTTARGALLDAGDVRAGAFVAAVGADAEDKQELTPALLASSAVVVDVLAQCAAIGDLHHALDAGAMRRDDVRGELADVVSGRRPGRLRDDEVVVFDSTGTALEDVAAAAVIYERACALGRGVALVLGT
ncbi:ornithine cyclodeaminase/mu-crystallin [Gemmatirosa kalamazoonensis]|uniref:Ornithine cyclodeaminase/mu-crystallin n=1 Tax=Gemmatirosa kalamazoonensis TaxID=861299 RepID=W0RDN2_9BACT|nr:ornithine cyclodeaminase family protein [Gemmatirosa kalamazoonensis]AHG88911.1 ornithine cyclodeaminase/mu-crystallin [Gemmatirosa kalamazoonensis]